MGRLRFSTNDLPRTEQFSGAIQLPRARGEDGEQSRLKTQGSRVISGAPTLLS